MGESKRDFKGVWIPKEIWLNKELSIMEKLFLVEIDSLDNDQNCFASNAHFSEFFDISKGRCTQIIKQLESKKLIEITLFRQGKQITKRAIRVVNKLNRGSEKTKQGYLENDEGSNTYINNTKDYGDLIKEILSAWKNHLPNNPQVILSRFKGSSREKTLINRIKESEAHEDMKFWNWYFDHLAKNPFNLGQNDRGWKADLEYATKKNRFDKNLELFVNVDR
ncbi:hypothetical protein [uncultured Paraglaciecola sp.]|uniref:hypothetical protein n=1 Tax=uncultured Paraglaciecola sp. TaxID=1765024 RepID=UPI002621C5BA|nr:hypothetical protein [uncultured Paraglaciecola sp.]